MFGLILNVYLVIFIYFTVFFLISLVLKNSSIVDIGWGTGFFVVSVTSLMLIDEMSFGSIMALIMSAIWGFRLTIYIFIRNKGKEEDFRYAKWRKDWGRYFYIRTFFQVFVLQSVIMIFVSIPLIYTVKYSTNDISLLAIIGLFVFLMGFVIEAISDQQKYKFKNNNKNGIMKQGLWKYSRHPNYFGESLTWIGIALYAFSYSNAIIVFISPILITFLLVFVSGIPMLEKKYKDNDEFQEYKKKTSAFIIWFTKKK